MQQNYKIFIGETLVEVVKAGSGEKINRDNSALYKKLFQNVESTSSDTLADQLTETKKITIAVENPEQEWNEIIKDLRLIEAAGGIVFNPEGKLLLIYRNGFWDLPKGKIEANEQIREAAIREVEEETQAEITHCDEAIFDITHHVYFLNGKGILKRSYWFKMKTSGSEKLTPQTEEGITKALWVSRNELEKYTEGAYPSIRYLFERLYK